MRRYVRKIRRLTLTSPMSLRATGPLPLPLKRARTCAPSPVKREREGAHERSDMGRVRDLRVAWGKRERMVSLRLSACMQWSKKYIGFG
jgi:hypothetical protein